ncbi:hypothetical protein C9374_000898 [Naegleria lovaniensis]|uniref:Uncharacterized protein n=1 Tax=Naegleria lovaniensis TaxID=51637 RepID=A0AA88GYM2_NAELO|nr:uncharacterized protein C9374_000898 [Naegleria lovaniensis]KAG2388048.1 hypothetical protein C9374_000898 [Naegleria lovaniensis]
MSSQNNPMSQDPSLSSEQPSKKKKNARITFRDNEIITTEDTSRIQREGTQPILIHSKEGLSSFIPRTPPKNLMANNSLRTKYFEDEEEGSDVEEDESEEVNDARASSTITIRTTSVGLMDLDEENTDATPSPKRAAKLKSSKTFVPKSSSQENSSPIPRSVTRSNFTRKPMRPSSSFYGEILTTPNNSSKKHKTMEMKRRNSIRRMKSVFDFGREESHHNFPFYDHERGAFIGTDEDEIEIAQASSVDDDTEISESDKRKFAYRTKMALKKLYEQFKSIILFISRFVYIITVGFVLFVLFNIFSVLSWISIFGVDHGKALFRLSFFVLNPFKKKLVFPDISKEKTTEESSLLIDSTSNHARVEPKSAKAVHVIWFILFGLPLTFIQGSIAVLFWFSVVAAPISKLIFDINKHMFFLRFRHGNVAQLEKIDNSINGESTMESDDSSQDDSSIRMTSPLSFSTFKWKLFSINVPLLNLLVTIPVTLGLHYGLEEELTSKYSMVIFVLSIVSAMPLAIIIGHCVESIVAQTSFIFGSMINATFGTIIELILYFLALYKELQGVVMQSITGAILAAILLTPGVSMIFGGIRYREQYFNRYAAGVSSILLFIAVVGAFLPCVYFLLFGAQELKCGQCLSGLPYNRTIEEPDLTMNSVNSIYQKTHDSAWNWIEKAQQTVKKLYGKKYKKHVNTLHGKKLSEVTKKQSINTIYGRDIEIVPYHIDSEDITKGTNQLSFHTFIEIPNIVQESNFTPISNNSNSTYSIRCVGCDLSLEDFIHDPLYQNKVRPLAFTTAIILPFAYIFGLIYSLRTHRFLMQKPPKKAYSGEPSTANEASTSEKNHDTEKHKDDNSEEEEVPVKTKESNEGDSHQETEEGIWPIWIAILVLIVCTAAYSFVAEVMTASLEPAFDSIGVNSQFAGLTFVAILPSLGEFLNAIQFALNDNVTLALEIGNVAAIQISLLQIPILVLGSFFFFGGNQKMVFSLEFPQFNLFAIFFAVFVLNIISRDGRSNYFHGLSLVFVYVFIVVGFFFIYF